MNQSMPKWILASINKHFNANRGTYPMYVEGQKRNTNKLQDWFELRIDGPDIEELSKNYYRYEVIINAEIMSAYNEKDMYRIIKYSGLVASIFTTTISIYKYGDEITDNASELVGCMTRDGKVEIKHFGRIKSELDQNVSQVQGVYYFEQ